MGKIVDSTYGPTLYELLTQTPKNYAKNNYYIETLQEKIWADWEYRPNRVDIEQEKEIGSNEYFPLEVVIQNVKNDKGEKVSDDYKRIVFKFVDYKVRLGTKFRFSYNFDLEEPNEDKSVWLTTNKDSTIATAGVVITRCNGTLGSIYIDENGKSSYHYEPVVCTTDLKSVGLTYNNVIVTPNAQIYLIVQHNQYTRDYYLNQRFIIGYDKVYKVKGINNFNSLSTYKPDDVGTMILYADLDEISPKDDFVTRIAFNKEGEGVTENPSVVPTEPDEANYSFRLVLPEKMPTELYSTPIEFKAALFNGETEVDAFIDVDVSLAGASTPTNYYELTTEGDGIFTLRRRKLYNRAPLVIKCCIAAHNSPTGEEMAIQFELSLRGLE